MASHSNSLSGRIDQALAPLEHGGEWQRQSVQTRNVVQAAGEELTALRGQVASIGAAAVKLIGQEYPKQAIASNTAAGEIIGRSLGFLQNVLQGTNNDAAQDGLVHLDAAYEASHATNNDIYEGSQLLAEQIRIKVDELLGLMTDIAERRLLTTLVGDQTNLENMASGSDQPIPFRAISEPMVAGVVSLREYQGVLGRPA